MYSQPTTRKSVSSSRETPSLKEGVFSRRSRGIIQLSRLSSAGPNCFDVSIATSTVFEASLKRKANEEETRGSRETRSRAAHFL